MTTTKAREVIIRTSVQREDADELIIACEPCGARIWLSKTTVCERMNLMGVPAKRIDILVQDPLPTDGFVMIEVCNKVGKFDGEVRTRIAIRAITPNTEMVDGASLSFVDNGEITIAIEKNGDRLWSKTFEKLRAYAYQSRVRELVMWHWARYFRHLDSATAEGVADGLVITDGTTVTAANRLASNALYAESRNLGWHKLTLREREKLGYPAEAGAWQREEHVTCKRAMLAGFGSPTGCGEYTLQSAR
jgi:hypothetical protein